MFRYGELDFVMAFYNDVVARRTLSAGQRGTPNWALGGAGAVGFAGRRFYICRKFDFLVVLWSNVSTLCDTA